MHVGRSLSTYQDIELILDMPSDISLNLAGDPFRLQQILVNLISAGVILNHTHEKTEFYTLV